MEIYAQVARRALGVLRDSAAEVDAADAWMRGQRVANPARVAWMLCPSPHPLALLPRALEHRAGDLRHRAARRGRRSATSASVRA
jgi:hypothetical protein